MLRTVVTLFIILLVVAPALDLGWNEPTLAQSQGARCPLHGTPAVTFEPTCLVVAFAAEWLLPFEALNRLPLISASIFIPPRASPSF
ncbi:MAG: hypothetical protein ACRERE_41715 [Candidatus Entotheonellia bacterium]